MLFFENIALAFTSLRINKMRSLLTMLGIIIGIGSVICIDTLGNSLTAAVVNMMGSTGGNSIYLGVQPKSARSEVDEDGMEFRVMEYSRSYEDEDLINDEMLEDLMTQLSDEIEAVTLEESLGTGQYSRGTNYANVTVTGVNAQFFEHGQKPEIISGSILDRRAYDEGKAVCIVSDYFCNNMYDGDTNKAIGKDIDITIGNKFYTFTIMGVYKYEANGMGMMSMFQTSEYNTTTSVYVPVKNIQKKTHQKGYSQVTVIANTENISDMDKVMSDIKQVLDKYYHANKHFEPSTFSLSSIFDEITKIMNSIKIVFSAIAAISLLVGGIGVMNIMLVSISERTREIGTRKALGASNTSIRIQFIVEAVVLCLVGGAIGILLGEAMGAAGVMIVSKMSGDPVSAVPSIKSIVVAVTFSLFIGVFFGFYPANKAAKMNPIDALRYE